MFQKYAFCLVAGDAFTSGPFCSRVYRRRRCLSVAQTSIRCSKKTSSRHFEHLL